MLIFITGADRYRAERKLRQLADHFKKKFQGGGLNADRFSAKDAELGQVREVLTAPPFLAEKRFVIVRDFSAFAENETFHELLSLIPATTIAVFIDDLTTKEFDALKLPKNLPECHSYPFEALAPAELQVFVLEEAKSLSLAFAPGIAAEFTRMVPADSWRIVTELEKLKAAAGAAAVTRDLLVTHIVSETPEQMFALLDAISAGDVRGSLRILESEFQNGTHPLQLMTMIERQARLMLAAVSASDAGIRSGDVLAKTLAIHPFVAKKLLALPAGSGARATSLLSRLVQADGDIKSGRADAHAAITSLLASMAR